MTLKKAYYYLYYKLYHFAIATDSISVMARRDPRIDAAAIIGFLELFLLASLPNYYTVKTGRYLPDWKHPLLFIVPLVAFLLFINYLSFRDKKIWRKYFYEFDQWPKKKNFMGTLAVCLIVLLVVANMVFSFYLLYQQSPCHISN